MNPFIEAQKRSGQMMSTQVQTGTEIPTQTGINQATNPMAGMNPANLINKFNRFMQSFNGDPKATVDQMIKNGQISQEQYNYAVQMANQMKMIMGIK